RKQRDFGSPVQWIANARRLIVPKYKQLVFDDRPAERSAKLILLERRFLDGRVLEVIARVERCVAEKLKYAAVKIVAAGLGNRIPLCSAAALELGRVAVGLDLELLDCIHVSTQHQAAVVIRIVVDSVEEKIVEGSARAVRDEAVLTTRAAAAGVAVRSGTGSDYAGAQSGKLSVVAAVKRQLSDLSAHDNLAER